MSEFDVSFTSLRSGEILFDVHCCSGTSEYMEFESADDVRAFFSSLGFDGEKIAELQTICTNLEAGKAFHLKMFLPRMLINGIRSVAAA
jgi:hypothetical protein